MADLKGLKRICMSCGARFYDLNKKPIICPSCNTEYTGEIKVKARRGRVADLADEEVEDVVPEVVEAETEEVEADEETVSLEEIAEDEDADEDEIPLNDDLTIDEDLDDVEDEDIEEDIAEDEEK